MFRHLLNHNRKLQSVRRGPASRSPFASTKRPLVLETLEDRTMPSILFHQGVSVTISDRNPGQTTRGTVLQNPQVELVFWGSKWNSGSNPALRTNVTNAVADIIQSTYILKLGQYGVGTGQLAGAAPVTITSSSPRENFTDANVSTMLQNNLGGSIPYNSNWLYMVITQPGSTDPTESLLGEHSVASASNGNFYYGWTENVGGAALDDITKVFSHEYVEAVTDPDGTGWQVLVGNQRNGGPNGSWNEICDGEPQNYTFRVDGHLVQSYYSQEDNAYAVDNGSTYNFLVSPSGVLTVQADPFSYSDLEVNLIGDGVFRRDQWLHGPVRPRCHLRRHY